MVSDKPAKKHKQQSNVDEQTAVDYASTQGHASMTETHETTEPGIEALKVSTQHQVWSVHTQLTNADLSENIPNAQLSQKTPAASDNQ